MRGDNGMRPAQKILVLAHDALLYGAQRSLLDILGRLDRQRYEPHVAIPSKGPFTDALRTLGIPFTCGIVQRWIFFPKPMSWRAILRRPWRSLNHPHIFALLSLISMPLRLVALTWLVRRQKITLIYTNTATVIDGAVLARICGLPHVWHLREPVTGNPDLSSPIPVSWLPSFTLNWSATVIINSRALATGLFGDDLPNKVVVLHNGINLPDLDNCTTPVGLPAIPWGCRITAVCGSVQTRKDILTFVRSAARLRDSHPHLHHLIIGTGPADYVRLVEAEIARHALNERVHLLGYRNDMTSLLSRIDVLISCATNEPFGRTLIEAMAAGKPVIATRSGGPEEIVEDGKTGYLVEVGDHAAIATKLAIILGDDELRGAMGEAGRRHAEELFDLRRSVSRLESIFDAARLTHMRHSIPDQHY